MSDSRGGAIMCKMMGEQARIVELPNNEVQFAGCGDHFFYQPPMRIEAWYRSEIDTPVLGACWDVITFHGDNFATAVCINKRRVGDLWFVDGYVIASQS